MATRNKTFKVDDKVFAKVKGFRPWPAKITKVTETGGRIKYDVLFYGTGEVASLVANNLFHYLEHRETLSKNPRKSVFLQSLSEIRNAVEESSAEDRTIVNADASVSTATRDGGNSNRELPNSRSSESRRSANQTDRSSSDRSRSNEAETANKTEHGESETGQNVAGPSRSRLNNKTAKKIMEKLDNEEMRLIPEYELEAYIAYAEYMQANPDVFKGQPMEARDDSVLIVFVVELNTSILAAIKFHEKEIPKFSLEFDRAVYEAKLARKLLEHKKDLLAGPVDPVDVMDHNYFDGFDMNVEAVRLWLQDDKQRRAKIKDAWKKCEAEMIKLDNKIRTVLGMKNADTKEALKCMRELQKVDVDDVMLVKHPEVVDVVRRLRRYIGNLAEWKLTPESIEEFQVAAQKIRDRADAILLKFKRVLKVPDSVPCFTNEYNNALSRFKELTRNMTDDEVFAITSRPYSRQFFIDKYSGPNPDLLLQPPTVPTQAE